MTLTVSVKNMIDCKYKRWCHVNVKGKKQKLKINQMIFLKYLLQGDLQQTRGPKEEVCRVCQRIRFPR